LNKYGIITLSGFLLSNSGSLGWQQVVAFVVSVVIITEVRYRFNDTSLPPLEISDAFAQGVTALALICPVIALYFWSGSITDRFVTAVHLLHACAQCFRL